MRNLKCCLLASSALVFAAPTIAAEVSGKGSVTYSTSSEVMELKGGDKLVHTAFKGVVLADDPKSPLNMSLQDCSGSTVLNKKGEPQGGGGYCSGVDSDGDIWWISWRGNAAGSDWSFISGTGKYDGVTGGGKTRNLLQTADRMVISWEGAWTTAK